MRKICIINQPEGLGDILYTQKIGYHFLDLGYEIFWPTNTAYSATIGEYLSEFKYFENSPEGFLSVGLTEDMHKTFLEYPGQKGEMHEEQFGDTLVKFVPLNHLQDITPANPEVMPICPYSFMRKKYAFVGISDSDWPSYLHIKRNQEKENNLYSNVLNLKEGEPYALIAQTFGTPGMTTFMPEILQCYQESESGQSGIKHVDLTFIEGFSLFDWSKVIEDAKEIWMEGSAITWLAEKLNLKGDTLNLHCRHGFHNPEIFYKFTNNWYSYDFSTLRRDRERIPKLGEDK